MSRILSSLTVATVLVAGVGTAQAQGGTQLAERAPRFLLASTTQSELVPVDVRKTPLLRRRIALDLRGATLEQALDVVARQTGLRFAYSRDAIALNAPVNLRADDITVAAALTEILLDAGVDVVFSPSGQTALVRRPPPGTEAQGGTITGRVTDASTQQGVSGVRVFLERTRWGTTTDSAGGYRLTEVAPGAHILVARRIGYRPHTQRVTVEADRETTVDVALQSAPSDMEAIVVTATGEQRLLELGHVVGRINADSVVRVAPVSSLSELLTARVPGLQVFQTSGTVGGQVKVRVRGPNGLFLNNQPIVVVDGVRYTTREREALFRAGGAGDVEPSSPLNDINVNDIESVEVVKGPSAATLYGTDAANGVLVITTKRGRPGPARWNAYAKSTITSVSTQQFPDIYWAWGTVDGVPSNPNLSCTLGRLASGQCTRQDSITVLPNPLSDAQLAIFSSKPSWEYGMNVAGGQQDLRYHFSANLQDATGPIQMPRALVEQLKQKRGLSELPEEWREPNAFTKLNVRSDITAVFGDRGDLRVGAGYVKSDNRTFPRAGPYVAPFFGSQPGSPYGVSDITPDQAFAKTTSERSDRFVGNASGRWRPVPWLEARATLGLDFTSTDVYGLVRPGDQPNSFSTSNGAVEDNRARQVATTAELGANATARRGRLSARTAVGAQYVRNLYTASGSLGEGLPPGASTVQRALTIRSSQIHEETVVLGGYLEEMLGLNERLFLTGALRVDGASTFGRAFDAAVYPKAGASWLLSEEPFLPRLPALDELRLRYAFGASGRQPNPVWVLPQFFDDRMRSDGQDLIYVGISTLGSPTLGPERVREHEFGFDARALANRLGLDVTWFRRRTPGLLVFEVGPVGRGPAQTNLGLVTQRGFEAQIRVRVLDTPLLSWDVSLQHSDYTTMLDDIGTGAPSRSPDGGYVEGFPLGARFQQRVVGWQDVDGDGLIDLSVTEIQLGDTLEYVGNSIPPRSQTLTSVLSLLRGRLRLSALLERKSGFTQVNPFWCGGGGLSGTCRAAVDPSTPFEEQVKAFKFTGDVPEKGDYTRLREVTVALDLPAAVTRAVHLASATLVVSARNLALWTDFSGPDPEVGNFSGFSGGWGDNAQAIPLSRVFSFRIDIGF